MKIVKEKDINESKEALIVTCKPCVGGYLFSTTKFSSTVFNTIEDGIHALSGYNKVVYIYGAIPSNVIVLGEEEE